MIVWPLSWNLSDRGWKLRMRWTALNCLSELTITSDLSNLLRSATLMKLRSEATYLLSAKIAKKQNHSQNNEALRQKETKY